MYGTGKAYHPNRPENNDLERSWTSYDMGHDFVNHSCNNGKPVKEKGGVNGSWVQIVGCDENDEEVLLTKATVRYIQLATSANNSRTPFFVSMGHHRPHLPWIVPKRLFDQ